MNPQSMIPPDSAAPPLPGILLSTAEVLTGQEIHQISVAMLPLQHAQHLENFADIFGEGWLDPKNNELHLQFHLVALFDNAKIDGLWLSVSGTTDKIALSPKCVASPAVGKKYPNLAWSAQSRFVVDEVVKLPDWATDATKFELFAGVAGNPEKVGEIYVSCDSANNEIPSNDTVIMASAPAVRIIAAIDKIARSIVDRVKGINRLFLYTVLLPSLLATIYFGLIASNVYISESKFIVRSSEQQTASPLGMIFKGAGFSRSQDDSYTVQEFILSRDALRTLDERMGIGKAFASKYVDIFSRFASLDWDDSLEALFKYYQNKVDVQLDSSSSIVTLTTRAFSAEDSFHMNQLLLEMSESLVNQLNERGRRDMIDFSAREVAEAEKKDKEATLSLARVQTENMKFTGKDGSLVSKFSEYQRLALEKEFSDKMLATALGALQEARNEALRTQLYLERIAQPSKPDGAMEPRRLRSVFAVFVLGLVLWGILTMLIASIKEHQD